MEVCTRGSARATISLMAGRKVDYTTPFFMRRGAAPGMDNWAKNAGEGQGSTFYVALPQGSTKE